MLLIKIVILHSILIIFSLGISVKLRNKYNNLKEKIGQLINNDNKGAKLFLDINEYEYPGNNLTIKRINDKLWQKYYDCLILKHRELIYASKMSYPTTITTLEGTSASLKCNLCLSPNDLYNIENIEWYFNNPTISNSANILIEESESTYISLDDRTLVMYNVKKNQEGLYWCQLGDSLSSFYFFNIIDETEPMIKVKPTTSKIKENQALPAKYIPKYDIIIYSLWSSWTPCSKCDSVGKRIRYGYCTISRKRLLKYMHYKKRNTEDEMNLKDKLKSIITFTMLVFQNIIPCRSIITPREIQNIPQVKARPSEVMEQFCKVKCPKNVIFQVKDNKGNIIESANNSAGIYSTLQGIPDPLPSSVRTTIYGNHGENFTLTCPGNLNSNLPIDWKIGIKIVIPEMIKKQSNGRIIIDPRQRIVFKKLRFADSNIYSCWQRNQLAGSIKFQVKYKPIVKLDHQLLFFTCIPATFVLIFIFWRAFRGRHNVTK